MQSEREEKLLGKRFDFEVNHNDQREEKRRVGEALWKNFMKGDGRHGKKRFV